MFWSIISSSSGNATLIKHKNTTILTDCGMSGKKLSEILSSVDISPCDIDALLLTHEHTDHTSGAGVISRRYNIPIYATKGTIENTHFGKIPEKNLRVISPQEDFEIGDIGVLPFNLSHDASEPVGYNFFIDGEKHTLATDFGEVTDEIKSAIMGSKEIILESNHDIDLLMYGEYPIELKHRILGKRGHLSNTDAAQTAVDLLKSGTQKIMLAHLSPENNTPDIAYQTTRNALCLCDAKVGKDIELSVANRFEITRF